MHSSGKARQGQIYMNAFVLGGHPGQGKWIQHANKDNSDCRKANLIIRDRYKDKWGETNLWRKYGMDARRYDEMLAAQGGVCAICLKTPEERGEEVFGRGKVPANKRKLHVDHCHASGRVRALLCWSCNVGLGKFDDDAQRLIRAAEYVKHHNPFASLDADGVIS